MFDWFVYFAFKMGLPPTVLSPITLQHWQQQDIPGLNALQLSVIQKCNLVNINDLTFPLP